jgi:hypothetical protein
VICSSISLPIRPTLLQAAARRAFPPSQFSGLTRLLPAYTASSTYSCLFSATIHIHKPAFVVPFSRATFCPTVPHRLLLN